MDALEFIDHGDYVVVPYHLHALGRGGIEVDAYSVVVFTIRDERIVELRLYRQKDEAFEAVGLER